MTFLPLILLRSRARGTDLLVPWTGDYRVVGLKSSYSFFQLRRDGHAMVIQRCNLRLCPLGVRAGRRRRSPIVSKVPPRCCEIARPARRLKACGSAPRTDWSPRLAAVFWKQASRRSSALVLPSSGTRSVAPSPSTCSRLDIRSRPPNVPSASGIVTLFASANALASIDCPPATRHRIGLAALEFPFRQVQHQCQAVARPGEADFQSVCPRGPWCSCRTRPPCRPSRSSMGRSSRSVVLRVCKRGCRQNDCERNGKGRAHGSLLVLHRCMISVAGG